MNGSTTDGYTKPTRESLADIIRAFLNSDIMAFEFDEQLDVFRDSEDPVIGYVTDAVWYHYDDCDDHLVCLTKQQWDFFQRLLLLLSSDCTIETTSTRIWSIRQLVAAASLAVFVYFAVQTGWGYHLLLLAVPFGAISMRLTYTHPSSPKPSDPYRPIISPFATFSDLERAWRSTGFRKTKYPRSLSSRQIRSPVMETINQIHSHVIWLLFAPFPLLRQSFPRTDTDVRATTV